MKKRYVFTIVIAVLVFASIGAFIYEKDTKKTKKGNTNSEETNITTTFWEDKDSVEAKEETVQAAEINESEAKLIAKGKLEGYEVTDAEQRSSTGEDYYLITMKKNDDIIRIYVDSQTGEILYQE